MHDAAAEDDATRRVAEHQVVAHLREVAGLEVPDLGAVGQLKALGAPAALDRGAGGQALEAGVVARADAGALVAGHAVEQHVAGLGVHHAVQQVPAAHHARAHAGADGHVHQVVDAAGVAERCLAQARHVDVGVVAHGHAEGVDEGGAQGVAAPGELGRLEYGAKVGARGVHAGGAEGADAQRVHVALGEPAGEGGDGLLRRGGGEGLPLQDLALLRGDGADHLGAARLKCSDAHALSYLRMSMQTIYSS